MSVLPVTMFRLAPANGRFVLAHISDKMRKLFIRPTMPEPIRQATKRTYRIWKENPGASAIFRERECETARRGEARRSAIG
jgi:hypothetical protein